MPVWIDSVCINQVDLEEKSSQVSIMGDIFQRASCVFACVGDHADNSDVLMEHLSAITDVTGKLTAHDDAWEEYRQACILKCGDYLNDLSQPDLETLWLAMFKFGDRPYWKRVWILQEVVLASWLDILCGTDWTYWTVLDDLACVMTGDLPVGVRSTSFHGRKRLSPELWAGMQGLAMSESQMLKVFVDQPQKPLDFFLWSPDLECSDPRDRIYGVLKLIQWPPDLPPIEADYSKSSFELAREALRYFRDEDDRGPDNLIEFAWDLVEALNISLQDVSSSRAWDGWRATSSLMLTFPKDDQGRRMLRASLFTIHILRRQCCFLQMHSHEGYTTLRAAISKNKKHIGGNLFTEHLFETAKSHAGAVCVESDLECPSIVAVLGANSQAGDILLQPFKGSPLLLVLRKTECTYEIVCKGLCMYEGSSVCPGDEACDCFDCESRTAHSKMGNALDLVLDEPDLWTYVSSAAFLQADGVWNEGILDWLVMPFCSSEMSSYGVVVRYT